MAANDRHDVNCILLNLPLLLDPRKGRLIEHNLLVLHLGRLLATISLLLVLENAVVLLSQHVDAVVRYLEEIVRTRLVLLGHLGQINLHEHLVSLGTERTQIKVRLIVLDQLVELMLHVPVGFVRVNHILVIVLGALRHRRWSWLVRPYAQHGLVSVEQRRGLAALHR